MAGLVVITPASGFVTPMYAMIMGFIGGAACFFSATTIKHILGYDDSLDAFGVHGIGGTVGALLTGVFAVAAVNTGINNNHGIGGAVEGNFRQLLSQFLAVLLTYGIAIIGSFVLIHLTKILTRGCGLSESDGTTDWT